MANVNIQLTKEQQQYLAFAVLVLGGGGFSYVKYFWLPVSATITETQQKIETVEKKIQKAKGQAGRLPKIKQELAKLDERAAAAEKRLPREQDLPAIIELMTDMTQRHNVALLSFTPKGQSSRPHFIEVAYDMKTVATYHDLGRFLAALALEERIFNVRGLTYGSPGGDGKMAVSFTLIAYTYKG